MKRAPFALLLASALAAQNSAFDPQDPEATQGTEGSIRIFHLGPFTIPAGRQVGGEILPGEYEQIVFAPNPGNVFVTGFDSRIVDRNRVPQDPAKFYLHHGVMLRVGVPDLTCQLMPGERFAGSGGERIPLSLPDGYGYRVFGNETIMCILHMQNYTLQPKQVFYQYALTVQPGTANLTPVRPWWLDVVNCTSEYTVPPGTGLHVKQRDYFVASKTTILSAGPHLHCGGVKLDILNKATGTPILSWTNSACPIEMKAFQPTPPIVVNPGTTVTIKATYQQKPNEGIDAMGIMLAYVVLN